MGGGLYKIAVAELYTKTLEQKGGNSRAKRFTHTGYLLSQGTSPWGSSLWSRVLVQKGVSWITRPLRKVPAHVEVSKRIGDALSLRAYQPATGDATVVDDMRVVGLLGRGGVQKY
eukprot:5548688-Amphidinium_carterae.4